MSKGVDLIAAERQRQLDEEGYHAGEDAGQQELLASAGASYALQQHWRGQMETFATPAMWPWAEQQWKPTPDNRIRELVKAGALIAAAIDAYIEDGYIPQAEGQTEMGLG